MPQPEIQSKRLLVMSDFSLSRRRFLGTAAFGAGALAGFDVSQSASAAAGRTTDLVRLTWGLSGLNLVARERGEFEKLLARDGIKVEWLGPFPNHAPTMQAVVGGSADFSFGGSTTPALAALIAGSPLVFTQFVVYEPRTTAIIARDDSGINRVEDLVGKSVAVNRSGLGEFLLVAALEKHKIDRSAVKFVYLNPPDAAPALASGKVDAWSMWSPGVDIARLQYRAHDIFLEGRDLDFQIDYSSYLTTRKFAADNPALVRAVNDAFRAEGKWISENTQEAEFIAQKAGKYTDEVRDRFIGLKRQYRYFPVNDEKFLSELQRAADWLTARKVLPEPIKVTDHLAQL
jgi:sulfonate transport system substrate-binding protein